MQKQQTELDPDFVDIMIQSLSVLSNVATLASAWIALRDQPRTIAPPPLPPGHYEQQHDNLRQQLRLLRRSLEDSFEAIESVLRVFEESRRRRPGATDILADRVRFGQAVMLTPDEFARVGNILNQLDSSVLQARNAARNLQFAAQYPNTPFALTPQFDTNAFTEQLNSILFDSRTIADAMTKLRLAQQQAEDFVDGWEKSLRRN